MAKRKKKEEDPNDLTIGQLQEAARVLGVGPLHFSLVELPKQCNQCGKDILTMAFRGTGFCSENCRKLAAGEVTKEVIERGTVETHLA